MFGHDKTNSNGNSKRGAQAKDLGVTILTSGCHFTGKLYCRGATRIGGTIEGQVIAEGLLVIEDEAVITGEVDAEDIVIHGKVEGKINARNRIEFCSTADVHAEVSTPSLIVHDGALFNGRTVMTKKVADQSKTDQKSGHKFQLTGGKKADPKTPDQNSKSLPDIKAARLMDDHNNHYEPEPAI
ncbi:MAG: polymer-forming cytoskeletal protein [Proteobacteria bacterium]|nr:polymer-forming cytoskeletal protein [Pseudomonadota bacterium]